MKTSTLSPKERSTCRKALVERQLCYEKCALHGTSSVASFYKKQLVQVHRTLKQLDKLAPLSANDANHLRGCLCGKDLEKVQMELRKIWDLSEPEFYAYSLNNWDLIQDSSYQLRLLNAFSSRTNTRYQIPLERFKALEILRTTELSFSSFADDNPYKVALVLANGDVYQIKPSSKWSNLHGPAKTSKRELLERYTYQMKPKRLVDAFMNYGKDHELNKWQQLLIQLIDTPGVTIND